MVEQADTSASKSDAVQRVGSSPTTDIKKIFKQGCDCNLKNYSISELVNSQGMLACSVCGQEFKPNKATKYIISGGYTCSWECFLKEAKRRDAQREERKADKDKKSKRS